MIWNVSNKGKRGGSVRRPGGNRQQERKKVACGLTGKVVLILEGGQEGKENKKQRLMGEGGKNIDQLSRLEKRPGKRRMWDGYQTSEAN